jgi:hypothetical protein
MDSILAEARVAQPKASQRVARARAARRKRLERTALPASIEPPATTPEWASVERRREVIASLWRAAEEQTRALEAARGAPVLSSQLKALVDVLERLERMEKSLPPPSPATVVDGQPATFEETNLLLEEFVRRSEVFAQKEAVDDEVLGPRCRDCTARFMRRQAAESTGLSG